MVQCSSSVVCHRNAVRGLARSGLLPVRAVGFTQAPTPMSKGLYDGARTIREPARVSR